MSHKLSNTSLSSLASSGQFDNGLLVQAFPSDFSHSQPQQSSFMLDPFETAFVHNQQDTVTQRPKLDVDTALGSVTGRPRSESRAAPYNRYRSESVSVKSGHGDEVSALLSAVSNQSYAPWTGNLPSSMNKMTLHHRSSSSISPLKHSPSRPKLTRAYRSLSFAIDERSNSKFTDVPVEVDLIGTGMAMEREESVRRDLTEKAEQMLRMSTTTQQDKARALWVRRWLHLSYTHAPGSTVPRQGLYHSYMLSCREYGVKPINSASFGKAVRSAYPGIKTRRLGVRGNSKYHYVALRPAIRTEAERLNDYGDSSGQWHVAPQDGSMGFTRAPYDMELDKEDDSDSEDDEEINDSPIRALHDAAFNRDFHGRLGSTLNHHHTSLDFGFEPLPLPVHSIQGFPSLAQVWTTHPQNYTISNFWLAFCHHCETLVSISKTNEFDRFSVELRSFWSTHTANNDLLEVSTLITKATAFTYDYIVQDILTRVHTPLSALQETAFEALAINLETILESSFQGFSRQFSAPKIDIGVKAARLFLRLIDLKKLSASLIPILSSADRLGEMKSAWVNLDRRRIADQCTLSCNCHHVESIFDLFSEWLHGSSTLQGLGEMLTHLLSELSRAAIPLRAIVSQTCFVTSQITRDFTLRSDPCFGLFQLLKTWIDDWVVVSVVRQLVLTGGGDPVDVPRSDLTVIVPPLSDWEGRDELGLVTAVPHRLSGHISK
ncbi:RFX DNA-binding domain-domain-containing protein [Naematelia encephala]|uniref:RFX DNA-binding domain-domain-containing protein n=1 Tax=Naematelia encephala TaxID=71784 RepID=A0A1Y2BLC6_9TREE|nr:RFX DNA-binding domain-domain-containing protein [Naematelia encephala]